MAKRSASANKPNKSEAIRQVLAQNPDAKPTQVASLVNEQFGYKITAQYVSVVKSQDKKKGGTESSKAGRTRRSTRESGPAAAASRSISPTADAFDAAIALIETAGGLDQARAVLERLERLRGRL